MKGVLLFTAFAGLFAVFFDRQARHSAGAMEDWGHAFVVPLISAWAIWQNRAELQKRRASTFWPGLLPLILGIVCYFFFIVGFPNHMFMGFSMVLTLAGLCLLLLGPSIFQVIFLPIAYLVFAVSNSEQVIIKITFALQQIAAQGAWLVLRVISALGADFVVFIDGNTLTVGGKALNVAEACSGMRMVVAFMALAGAVALLTTKVWWQRVSLMLLAIPVAVFNNILRVAVLGLLSLWKPDLATGDAHMVIGTVLLGVGLAMFMGIQWLLSRIVREAPDAKKPIKKAGVTRA
ncbi:MAG TPA: exosortase/archaeosortase family protein [Phycisphaerales bacterium]|nr:exosortase/archaeosortase family protein [Phycisphaerales bacterium]